MYKHTIKICLVAILLFCLSLVAGSDSVFAQTNPNSNIEALVRASFPDMTDMITIAKCESGFRQFSADGTPLRGGTGKNYIGIFQISESVHKATAENMALDIYTPEGNIAYARHLFFQRGTAPWISCLADSTPVIGAPTPVIVAEPAPLPVAGATTAFGQLSNNLSFGMVHPDVATLQKILNANGYVVATSGAGSPGNETAMFGKLTREAVRKFQCAKLSVCDGSESTTGFGRVGPMTRASLNALSK